MEETAVKVEQSRVGLGVFAGRPIPEKVVIGKIEGDIIADEEFCSEYSFDIGDDLQLDPHAPFRFLNHSCDPNCEFDWWYDDEELTEDEELPDESDKNLNDAAIPDVAKSDVSASEVATVDVDASEVDEESQDDEESDQSEEDVLEPERPRSAYLISLREISLDEELTIDYNWSADGAIPCQCGALSCRGWVVCEDELPYVER